LLFRYVPFPVPYFWLVVALFQRQVVVACKYTADCRRSSESKSELLSLYTVLSDFCTYFSFHNFMWKLHCILAPITFTVYGVL
jgi:hypothetical protein